MRRTANGQRLLSPSMAWLIGGSYIHCAGGIGWRPSVIWMVRRFYAEGWRQSGYSLWRFIRPTHNDCHPLPPR